MPAEDDGDQMTFETKPESEEIETRVSRSSTGIKKTGIQSMIGSESEMSRSSTGKKIRRLSEEIETASIGSNEKKPVSKQHTHSLMMYIVDTIDSLIEYLCKRVLLMPATIRYFAKAVFDHHKAMFAAEKNNKKSSSHRAV